MQTAQALKNLILFFKLGFELLKTLLGSTQTVLRSLQNLFILFRALQVIIHAGIVVFETITIFAEYGFIEARGIRGSLELGIIVQPLVCKEHLGIYSRHIALADDAHPPARRQEQDAHQHGKG